MNLIFTSFKKLRKHNLIFCKLKKAKKKREFVIYLQVSKAQKTYLVFARLKKIQKYAFNSFFMTSKLFLHLFQFAEHWIECCVIFSTMQIKVEFVS